MGVISSSFHLVRAALVLARHDALLPGSYRGLLPFGIRFTGWIARFGMPLQKKSRGERLAAALQQLGPSYVKLGQFLATRSDILSQDVVDGLVSLKDNMPAFDPQTAEALLQEQLGETWSALHWEPGEAVAAASVAQVHAVTDQDGIKHAIKLLRPGIEKRIQKDIAAMQLGARLASRFFPASERLEPVQFVKTIARSLILELDLRMEAAAASELREIAEQVDGIQIPEINWDLAREKVLVMQWVDGIRLTEPAALDAARLDRVRLAKNLTTGFLRFALDHGVFHADQHEGNLFALANGELALVDFGIVGRIGPAQRKYLAEILYGFIRRDYRRVAEVHFEAGYVPNRHAVDDFASALRAVGEPVFGKRANQVSMGNLLLQLFAVTARFDMHLRPELVLLQKTMVQVEGVARNLDPQHDLWGAATEVVEGWITRELGPEGQINEMADDLLDLRDALRKVPALIENADQFLAEHKSMHNKTVSVSDDKAKLRAKWRDRVLVLAGLVLMLAGLKFVFFMPVL